MQAKPTTKEEFLEAYDAYSDAIYRHCFFRVYSESRAEELVQETFLRTWEYLSKGKTVDNMRVFLYKVATNLIIDDSRKKRTESLDSLLERSPAAEPSYAGHADVERDVLLYEVRATMAKLPEDERKILSLRYVDDLDPKDIAEVLGITPNNVSVRLNRAMKRLREEFGEDAL